MTMGVQERPGQSGPADHDWSDTPATETRRLPPVVRRWASAGLVAAGLSIWIFGLSPVDPDQLDGWGLLRALSGWTLAGYPVVIIAGILELLRDRPRRAVLLLVSAALLLMVYGLQPLVLDTARLPTAWLHAGFAEQILRTGEVIPQFDARFSWPGFFAVVAFWARAAGLDNVIPMLEWAPVINTGLAAVAIHAVARSIFGQGSVSAERKVWMATWLFLCSNFVEQDYFSPQGMALILLYAALALTVRYLASPGIIEGGRILPWKPRPTLAPDRRRVPAELGVAIIALALAPTHQLTPYVLAITLGVLLVWGRLTSPWLPVIAALPALAWFALAAKEFWLGNLLQITGAFGDVVGSVEQGVGDRLVGDTGHQAVVMARIALTGFALALAMIGWLRHRRATGSRTWTLPALGASAFVLAALQPYGGEIFLRCFLYALPWLVVGGALALNPGEGSGAASRRSTRVIAIVAAVVMSVLCLTTVFTRGGNDAYSDFKPSDGAAMEWIYSQADRGDLVVAPYWHVPMRTDRVADVAQLSSMELGEQCTEIARMPHCFVDNGADFVLLSPQEEAAGEILYGLPPTWMDKLRTDLTSEYGYRVGHADDGRWVLVSR